MKKIIFVLAMVMGCAYTPAESQLEAQREEIRSNIYLSDPSKRLNLMPPPVVVISKGAVSHGVFREKYKTYDVIVRAGNGKFYTFTDTAWESVNVGDVLK